MSQKMIFGIALARRVCLNWAGLFPGSATNKKRPLLEQLFQKGFCLRKGGGITQSLLLVFPEFTGAHFAPIWLGSHIILPKFGKAITHLPAGFVKIHHGIAPDQHVAMAEFSNLAKSLLITHTKCLFIVGRTPFFPFTPIAAFIDLFC